jgi:hypothetical protein
LRFPPANLIRLFARSTTTEAMLLSPGRSTSSVVISPEYRKRSSPPPVAPSARPPETVSPPSVERVPAISPVVSTTYSARSESLPPAISRLFGRLRPSAASFALVGTPDGRSTFGSLPTLTVSTFPLYYPAAPSRAATCESITRARLTELSSPSQTQ